MPPDLATTPPPTSTRGPFGEFHREAESGRVRRVLHGLPTALAATRLREDAEVSARLGGRIALQPATAETSSSSPALLLDTAGLERLGERQRLGLPDVLRLGIALARTLARMHALGFVHGALHPDVVWIDRDIEDARLAALELSFTDAGSASREPQRSYALDLRYLAPELATPGLAADRRADLYALGVLLYEAASARLPFLEHDPVGIHHAHSAIEASPLTKWVPEVSPAFAQVVDTLLRKDPQDRYQSATGVLRDLQAIAGSEGDSAIDLRGRTVSDRPRRSDGLVGRSRESSALAGALRRCRDGGFLFVSGPSGSGKTALVTRTVAGLDGEWIVGSGKSDQLRHGEPLAALQQPLESVLRWIAGSSPEVRSSFAAALAERRAETIAPLQPILPALARLAPSFPPVATLAGQAGEIRLRDAFHGLFAVLGSIGSPVALVIDDLQWADAASVAVLRSLVARREPPPVAIVCTCRDDSIAALGEISALQDGIRAHPSLAADIHVGPFGEAEVLELVSGSLDAPAEFVRPLASSIHAHSQGNVMFVVEELQELWRRAVLFRSPESGEWTWSASDVSAVARSKKLSELMGDRVRRTPEEIRRVLAHGACFGSHFSESALAAVTSLPREQTRMALLAAGREGLLVPAPDDQDEEAWRFPHDQVQGAAYALLGQDERMSVHCRIGERILERPGDPDKAQVEAIAHLNAAAALLRDEGRSSWLASHDLAAARILLAKAAFADAYACLGVAVGMLGPACWDLERELAWEVHVETARAACLAGAPAHSIEIVNSLRGRCGGAEDEVALLEIAIDAYKVLDRFEDAIESGRAALTVLGVRLPKRPTTANCLAGLLATHVKVLRSGASHLASLPRMTDGRATAAMRILAALGTPSFLVMPALFLALVDTQLKLSLLHGNSPESPYAYALYAIMLAGPLHRIENAHQVSLAALDVLRDFDPTQAPRTRMATFVFVMPWKIPLADCLDAYVEGSRRSLAVGDPEFANYNASAYAAFSLHAGPDLATACARMDSMRERILPLGQKRQYAADIYHQTMLNLRSVSGDPFLLAGPVYDESVHGPAHATAKEMNGHLHLCRLILAVLFERPEQLAESIAGFRECARPFDGMYVRAAFFFHEALALLRFADGPKSRWRARQALLRLRGWSRHCPANFAHKVLLLRAELALASGHRGRAMLRFARAAAMAESAAFHLEAGLAWEGARKAAEACGDARLAGHYRDEARRVYEAWGALGKVRDLDIRYGGPAVPQGPGGAVAPAAWNMAPESLDLVGVLRASQDLSKGMDLDATIRRIMHTVAGIAGAQSGALVIRDDPGWSVLATARTRDGALEVRAFPEGRMEPGSPEDTCFATSVLEEVEASGVALIQSEPESDPAFRSDPHVLRWKPRSLLCCPIQHGNGRQAFIYLEHRLRRDAFGAGQLEAVRLLSTQAAISLDNARLYARQLRLSAGAHRFVPAEFLGILGKTDVDQVALSDHVEAEMTILVCDIRGFSAATETMPPEASFAYINEFFALVGPAVREHHGFIMKYMGDGFMALFPRSADDAARTALAIPELLRALPRLRVGIGLHTGPVSVGAVGEKNRIQGDVMSDVANVACRLESLTREHPAGAILSAQTLAGLSEAFRGRTTPLGRVPVKGRVGTVEIHALA